MRNLFLTFLALCIGAAIAVACNAFAADPSVIMGVPQPSAQPTPPVYLKAGVYGDPNGCLYAYANGRVTILAGAGCAFPTGGASMTPFPTSTPTPAIP